MVDTIFALASGPPPAAVSIIRISGPRSIAVGEAISGRELPRRAFVLSDILDPGTGETLDRGLVFCFPSPGSFTGEDCVEFQVHGSRAVVASILATLAGQAGCRPAKAGEFTQRAFFNGKLDLTAAEGLADLIDSETELQRRQALAAMSGGLSVLTSGWRSKLVETLALIEATIDFSDEGEAPVGVWPEVTTGLQAIRDDMRSVLADSDRAESVKEGFLVVILGPPNAGKSSFINAVARRDIALVSEKPGTTRDLIEVRLNIGGALVTFVDTAGIRLSTDVVETEGIRRARSRGMSADVVLWLNDGTSIESVPNELDLNRVLRVSTKADLKSKPRVGEGYDFSISTRTGFGIDTLLSELGRRFTWERSATEPGCISNVRQRFEVTGAVDAIERALSLDSQYELVAEELHVALRRLERLVGTVAPDDVLKEVFSRFCMGK